MVVEDLFAGLPVRPLKPAVGPVRVCDLTEDSRTVVPGSLFVARRGAKADGRQFVADAVKAGAVAILTDEASIEVAEGVAAPVLVADDVAAVSAQIAERFYGRPSSKLTVIAVTGTNGKSTTTYLIWKMLNAASVRCGLVGTVVIDDGAEVAAASMTTPPAIEMSRTLSVMVEAGCRAVVLEASSHALHQKRIDALSIDVAAFTNLTGDHLDYHGTMEAYAAAKARLFTLLDPGGRAVLNADDPAASTMAQAGKAPVWWCSAEGGLFGRDADCRAEVLASSMTGMDLRLSGPWGTISGRVPLIGAYNVMNTLQAVACCHAAGLSAGQLQAALPSVSAPPGRLEPVLVPGAGHDELPAVFVDYAHSDDSLANVLAAVRGAMRGHAGAGQLWVVFGCGGDRDRTKRPRMGAAAANGADRVVVTSDNPRSEHPGSIVKEVLAGVPGEMRDRLEVHVEREQAIQFAIEQAGPHDVIVIAGKGHETEQIRSDGAGGLVKLHFDDREVARAYLSARLGNRAAVRT